MRPDAAWLVPGLLCLVLGRWIQSEPGTAVERASRLAPGMVDDVGAVLASESPTFASAWAISSEAAVSLLVAVAVVAACVLGLAFVAAALLRRLGPVDPGAMAMGGGGAGTRTALVGACAAAVVGVFVVRRAMAGGARAADASLGGLTDLWTGALASTLTTMGIAMIVLGALEGWRSAARIREGLMPTSAQAAHDARHDGTRRR